MIIAIDLDGMLISFPEFFANFVPAMRHAGHQVGLLTGRPESQKDENLQALKDQLGLEFDFAVFRPDDLDLTIFPSGVFKATVCNDCNIDVLFDDFQYSDPEMIADFFSLNAHTIPMTSWAYDPEEAKTTILNDMNGTQQAAPVANGAPTTTTADTGTAKTPPAV